jgi:dTDP-4-dehydrorhamnose reductase
VKILLTGTTGQLGWHLERMLPKLGETHATGRETIDLSRPETICAAIRALRPDLIVNAAAYTNVDKAESEETLAHAINAIAPGVLAEEARRLDAVLMHYSTDYVFDGTSSSPYLETDTPRPINAYGRSKLDGEIAIAATEAIHLILRTSWVYDWRGQNFLATMLRAAEAREELRIVDDQVGGPTWAHAIAEATITLVRDIKRIRDGPGTYHLAAVGAVSRYDFVRRAIELASQRRPLAKLARAVPAKSVDFPLPAARPAYSALDSAKLRQTFGITMAKWEIQLHQCLENASVARPE